MKRLISIARRGALVAAVGLMACGDGTGTSGGSGHLSLLLKDAPGDVVAAVVTITEINLQGGGGTTVLSNTAVTTNLLTLAADAETLLDNVVVPAGTYSQLRFVLSGAYIEVDNGDGTTSIYASAPDYPGLPPGATVAGDLQMPSMRQSGLKVTLPRCRGSGASPPPFSFPAPPRWNYPRASGRSACCRDRCRPSRVACPPRSRAQ